jgi:hypothetical protein
MIWGRSCGFTMFASIWVSKVWIPMKRRLTHKVVAACGRRDLLLNLRLALLGPDACKSRAMAPNYFSFPNTIVVQLVKSAQLCSTTSQCHRICSASLAIQMPLGIPFWPVGPHGPTGFPWAHGIPWAHGNPRGPWES